ncbi:MAG: 16S rRNA (guanine(527)-N(7))-methyltransferase RsmG [Deltaproteobacteria bacterium]|jgi:16S rRNA (guanine527-N7)-methyltransferase|nr:16S rRNA (guanine(527)-N(7))-methyltransferase RsmG [Deltaproteobacteria bacterium]
MPLWGEERQQITFERFRREFLRARLTLSPLELKRLVWLDLLLEDRNEELDLSRIEDPVSRVVKHYLDSALAANLIQALNPILDLGTGAGFPGLPMAILRQDWRLILAEPRAKRLKFIDEAVSLLGLENVELHPHKVTANFKGEIGSIVSRDFGSISSIMPIASSILPPQGRLYLLKGLRVASELTEAKKIPSWDDFEDLRELSYDLGPKWPARRVICLTRKGKGEEQAQENRVGENKNLKASISLSRLVKQVASPMNSSYRQWLKLTDARNIKKQGLALYSGRKQVKELLEHHGHKARALLAVREQDYQALPLPNKLEIFHLRPEIFPQIDLFGAKGPILLIEAQEPPNWSPQEPFQGLRLFVPFQDPVNVGALIRSAAALGAEVVLLQEAANPFLPKALRASGPYVYQVKLWKGPALSALSQTSSLAPTYALSAKGADIRLFKPPPALNLVMGLEGPGLDLLWPYERRLSIPMRPGVESLNAAAAAAIAMCLVNFPR